MKDTSLKIESESEFNIPGTEIVLEKGDIVNIKTEKGAASVEDFPGLKNKINHQFNGLVDLAMDKLVAFLDEDPHGKQLLWKFIREG